ncbi:mammalian cell entry protein [Mycobacteroides chelonae]|jgi:phospholipid/cholesterol/gamma-HCH transport system substrate-binding protein|uniref:Mammalian cell entry protein n=1 Tax=Mycobacteroides chelonae TaxID=1774 RepID=A0A1S1LYW7_MYCCH|nr:MCE family protein [Mycobacteroides chelonae]PKQ58616.1 mammalian cell entry protein [Mycobacterium sp. MHSD3]SKL81471.1 virulence factor Mce family protein [Mycobacteroides abscessus subsp. bolletii]MBF9521785.1 MCE family protein [Mycobacteroides chelonae]MBV0916688.1 MCE family protein [Mycobacteroides chelonae]OHU49928.1 mammalian cell entry protein [Mycobacteroides chelonae]
MKVRGAFVGLALFTTVCLGLTWLVYVSLRRDISGSTTPYQAMVSDVFGLREGDDVRIAGVRVGRVEKVELAGDTAKVSFVVQNDQHVFGNTVASVTYQNIIGQRYLGLSIGNTGSLDPLPAGSTIPLERTEPSFDVGRLLHGYAPLFSTLDPKQLDNLTNGVVASLQGDTAAIPTLVNQTTSLTRIVAGKDESLDQVITNLDAVSGILAEQDGSLDQILTQTRQMMSSFNAKRPELVDSLGSFRHVAQRLSAISDIIDPPLNELINRQPGVARHMVGIESQTAFLGSNLPLILKGVARITQSGSYVNIYACDLNALGFFPGLNIVVPIIVDAATPGNKAQHTPKCRSMANG